MTTCQITSKNSSTIERMRKPISRVVAVVLLSLVVVTRVNGFESNIHQLIELSGFLLVFAGVCGRIWCTLHIAGRKDRELCTAGPYELCRNPLYLFSFLGFLGILLAAQSLILAGAGACLFLWYYRGVIRSEEARLCQIFGARYESYLKSTPRFWPRRLLPAGDHELVVNSRIFTRSLREVLWFLLAIVLMELIEMMKTSSNWEFLTLPI